MKLRIPPVIKLMSAAALVTVLAGAAFGQETDAYAGFKIPPLEISSEFPYQHQFVEILGSKMAYVDEGEGDPILFLHGQPTSSYLWRNIMPHVEGQGRIVAPDNIGFGLSDQPELDYTFGDHYRYFEAFVAELGLQNITLVVHDWGSGLGLHYAAQHPENVKAIVTMEALMAPVLPAASYDDMRPDVSGFFQTVRAPETGARLIIKDNAWLEGYLPGFIARPLAAEALEVYQAPFRTEKSRIQVNQWPNEIPIAQQPQQTHDIITAYNAFMEKTDIPWLFFYSTPGVMATPEAADYWTARARNIETVYIGHGLHYVQEDSPYAIGRQISDWLRRLDLK